MPVTEHEVDILVDYCTTNLGKRDQWTTPPGYPNSLALCIIDSTFSTGSHYSSVVNVINRYRAARGDTDGAKALLESIADAGGPRAWATGVVDNLKPAHTRPGAVLKADVIQQAAKLLVELEVDTVPELVRAVSPLPQKSVLHARWTNLPSQSSGVTFNYLLILAGLPSVKPDRMVLRFLADALGGGVRPSSEHAVELIQAAAARLKVSARALDHTIWRAASQRE